MVNSGTKFSNNYLAFAQHFGAYGRLSGRVVIKFPY